MRWQRVAQAAIALFVIGFIALLATTLRQERAAPSAEPAPPRAKPEAPLENPGGGRYRVTDPTGKERWVIDFGTHVALPDGRQQFGKGVQVTINRGDRQFLITADTAEVTPAGDEVKAAVFRGDVTLKGADGLTFETPEATYTHADGLIKMPGAIQFTKGRTSGSGRNSTYDQAREVFWIYEDARISVAPDAGDTGALEATADAIGIARLEHYVRLQGDARIDGQGRLAEGEEIVIRLTEDDERVRVLELRGNSRITSAGERAQNMSARDIDLTYAADGRTLQAARLIDNAVLQLAGSAGAMKRIAASTIDLALGPDGSTLTGLDARERVQVDLPADGKAPAKRICSATLHATGAESGLREATFDGGVEYSERRNGRRPADVPAACGGAADRTARSRTLVVETQPGFGEMQRADFRGDVKFSEPPDFSADAQRGIYDVARDRLELSPAEGLPGPPSPSATDGSVTVTARTIQFGLSTRELSADTKVRSTIRSARSTDRKLPSVLSDDTPVNVTSNRLEYKGRGSTAVYSGSVTMWQGNDTTIKAPTIAIDDKTGNLRATGGATTSFPIEDAKSKGTAKKPQVTVGSADTFTYDDAKRLATYKTKARISGPQGDLAGETIELFLKEGANELERVEAYGANGVVQVREANRLATGSHLTYTAADDRYLIIGTPVEIIEAKNGTCTLTRGTSVSFNRATESATIKGSLSGAIPSRSETLKACPPGLGR